MAAPVAAVTISAPGTSTRTRLPRDRRPAPRAGSAARTIRPTGTLMKKIHRQPGPEVSTPPRITPTAEPAPASAAQTPRALFRSAPVKVVVTSDSADGDSSAAPAP